MDDIRRRSALRKTVGLTITVNEHSEPQTSPDMLTKYYVVGAPSKFGLAWRGAARRWLGWAGPPGRGRPTLICSSVLQINFPPFNIRARTSQGHRPETENAVNVMHSGLRHNVSLYELQQESLANAKVNARQHCVVRSH